MAKIAPPPANPIKLSSAAPPKLPRLPKGTKIHKRPLLHPPISSPRSGPSHAKTIYLSTSSPFIATIKRVHTYLDAIDARASASSGQKTTNLAKRAAEGLVGKKGDERAKEEVLVKATGKAVEKALRVALHFQGLGDMYTVQLRTGSVGAVDDLVVREGMAEGEGVGEGEEGEEREETRVRRTSMLEVVVRLR